MVLVFLLGPAPAVAKKTPTVCDDLSGKAYGLCNAYCEELDCDWDPNASEPKCDNLRSRYSSITGEEEFPSVLQIFAEYTAENDDYSACGFGPSDVGDRFGVLDVGGVVPAGYRKLYALEGEGQNKFHCFTKDADGGSCEKLTICLWDSGPAGDDYPDPHGRAGREWTGGTYRGTGGTKSMDIMWRFMKASVGVPY